MLNYNLFESNAYKPDDAEKIFGGTTYLCQTFTPGTSHMLWAVQVKSLVSGTVTCKIYETLLGKPTGTALGTGTATSSTGVGWIDFVLSSGVRVNSGTVYAMVFSSASAVRLRYNQSGTYTAGFPYASTDSGVTWTAHTDGDFLFTEWGMSLPSGNTTRIQLYPRSEGSHTQLVPVANGLASEMPNWQCVNDPVDAPNEGTDCVAYYVTDATGFLSGKDESVAGGLSGTSAMWRTFVDGLWGVGTTFDTELEAGDLLTSPIPNAFYSYNYRRIAEVDSIQSALALTFKPTKSGNPGNAPKDVWWFTPRCNDDSEPAIVNIVGNYGGRGGSGGDTGGQRVGKYLTGTWTFTPGSKVVTGSGGNAIDEAQPWAYIRYNTGANDLLVAYVATDNEIHLAHSFPGSNIRVSSTAVYCSYSWTDDLTYGYGNGHASTATMWTKKTKKDSYLLKGTQAEGDIRQIDVVFRCGMTDTDRMTTCYIATYDSSAADKSLYNMGIERYYEIVDPANHVCGTLTDGTGVATGSPITATWVAADGFPYYSVQTVDITTAGTFTLEVLPNRKAYVGSGTALVSTSEVFGEGTHTIVVYGTGNIKLYAPAYDAGEYTDAEIATTTHTIVEAALTRYSRVVFCPGTWKIYNPALCSGTSYTIIGVNNSITSATRYDILASACDGSNDEVQWKIGLNGYRTTTLENNLTGYVLEDYVVAGRNIVGLSTVTATAQPFLRLGGVEVLGTEETLTPPHPSGIWYTYPEYEFKTYRQTIARPGGGVFTKDDLITLEAGIILGNLSDYQNIRKVLCTQIYAEAFVSLGDSSIETVGLTQYGFKTFDNRMDEWAMPVFPNGMNMLCHKIYHHSLTKYFSDAMQRLRGVTSRFINRRRTSTTMGKRTTSGGITH